jgi:hypothetical protein
MPSPEHPEGFILDFLPVCWLAHRESNGQR